MLSSNQVLSELDVVYEDLQRDTSKTRCEKNKLMIESFQRILLKNLSDRIEGFFYKRKSYYFDKKDNPKAKFFAGLFNKIKTNSSKYDRRFFRLDINSYTFSYAKDKESLDKKPHYATALWNIQSVKRNIVSMPYQDKNGQVKFKEHSIWDTNMDIDRGPNDNCKNVFEIKVLDRMFTLYTPDNSLMEKFVHYIEKMIELRDEIQSRQKMEE